VIFLPVLLVLGGTSVWAITPEERGKHDKQFDSLAPLLGYVSGEQARKFFLQSGLPPSVLAEIWHLADTDNDGKMDRLEFSIAMKLIKLRLQGQSLPSSLPIIMKQSPTSAPTVPSAARFGMGSMPNLSVGLSSIPAMPILTPIPINPMQPLVPVPMTLPLIGCQGNPGLPNGTISLLPPPLVHNSTGLPLSGFSSPMTFSPPSGMSKANSLLDLGSSSSNSSSTTSLASNSPKMGANDWAIPQASRLKYRQQFNTLDKLMSGYLSGPQVRNALLASNLTQTQLATIWTLADVDRDGRLQGDEFILAMHLVDVAKSGRPLPLTLPQDLVPPSLSSRGGMKPSELVNGTGPPGGSCLIDTIEIEPPQKNKSNVSFEDKLKENFARGSAELEKRRQALEDALREEGGEWHQQMYLVAVCGEQAARQEMERQRREEWERGKKEELSRRKTAEQEEISRLRARKKSLELELEAVGNKHKQISDRLRDAQSKRWILKAEVDLINQKRDARISEINTLQLQFKHWQEKLSQLVPEQQRLTERLRSVSLSQISPGTLTSLSGSVTDKGANCRRLKDQLDTLEKETTDKLAQMDQYNKELKELREKQARQQAVLDDLYRVKEEKQRELHRRRGQVSVRRHLCLEAVRDCVSLSDGFFVFSFPRQAKPRLRAAQEKKDEEMKGRRKKLERGRPLQKAPKLTVYRALYSFQARNSDELSIDANCLIEVDEQTIGEPGWLCGTYRGNQGWFPQSYAEKRTSLDAADITPSLPGKTLRLPPAADPRVPDVEVVSDSSSPAPSEAPHYDYSFLTPQTAPPSIQVLARAVTSWSGTSDGRPESCPSTAEAVTALLSLSQGDTVSVLQQREDWCLGQLNGTQGWFPKDRVTLLTNSHLQYNKANANFEPFSHSSVDGFDSGDSANLEASSEYVALYTYESPEAGDLTFVEGDVIVVTAREGEWWGCIGDQTGVFPSNYVRPVELEVSRSGAQKPEIAQAVSNTVTPAVNQLSLSPGQLIVVLAKNSTGWWLGELQARGKKRQRGWFHSSCVKLLSPTSVKSSPSPLPVCQVIAMYDYAAANQDELSFSKGQLINILDKTNPDWWKGEVKGVTGLLPTNYVKMTTDSDPSQQWCADLMTLDTMSPQERKRQGYIHELIHTEETYVEDLELVLEVFYKPMSESGRLTEEEMGLIFVNWRELIMCNTKLLKAVRVRKKTGGENMPVQLIGDLLASELAHMQPYIRFCSCQLNAAALLQSKTHDHPDFKDFLKKIATNYRCKGMPLSSFLLKPMQRITRYPLLIKNILEHTPDGHADRGPLREALERAEELCSQVNEGVREKENSDRLEWIQTHVQCEGPIEHLVFNSLTNCLGPRKLLHSGRLYKTKSSRELWAFLFSDFLLLTHSAKQFSSSGSDKLFSLKSNVQLKMYKTPLFLNEVLVKMPPDPSSDEPLFHVSHIDRVYTLKTETLNERTMWVQKIKAASEHFIETEKKKREKAYQARSLKSSGIGRLLVTVTEAQELRACKPNGKSNPYCELTMGAQCYTSRTISDTLNPKWNFNCQFFVRDLYQDVLCITVFEKDQFSPDDFLGRTEVPVATIKKEMESKGAANRRLLLHEVATGEVWVKLDLQLYE
uniref:Intersectin 2a n=1 Tax=Tetraodon nigroviridis TaxID=99883 RepID=H3C3D0_TETNG